MTIDQIVDNIINWYTPFESIFPFMILAFVLVFIFTPLIGKFAAKIGAIDLPATLRLRTDRSKEQRLHTQPKLRLGGAAIMLATILLIILSGEKSYQITGILLGLIIIFITGFIDDKYELSSKHQLFAQILAAIIAVISGITISSINIGGFSIDFNAFSTELFSIGNFTYIFNFPSDIITVIWIVTLMNALNWMCGIDALGETITVITSIALGFISFHTGNFEVALISFILAGSVLGFLPYNFPPAKLMGGSVSDISFGFLLATLAIMSQAKLTTTGLLLLIPVLDMTYVLIRRIIEYKVINPFKLMTISGRIHLHHRILNLGFDTKATLYIEALFFGIFALLAMYLEEVGENFRIGYAVVIIIFLVALIGIFLKQIQVIRKQKVRKIKRAKIIEDVSPEEKYKY